MFAEIFKFELKFQLRQPIVWISMAIFCILTFFAITTDTVTIGGSIGAVNRNAPYVIVQILSIMSIIGVFVTTAFVANVVNRDFELNTHSLFFSTPMRRRDYLGGRFLGALAVAFLIFVPVAGSIWLGSLMPWLEPERIGPFMAAPYLYSLLFMVLPNLFFMSAVFFSLAALTRSVMYTYVGVVSFFVLYGVSQSMMADLDNQTIAALADPFGMAAFELTTKYWTVFERNGLTPGIFGPILVNRILWTVIGALIVLFTIRAFKFTAAPQGKAPKKKAEKGSDEMVTHIGTDSLAHLEASRSFGAGAQLRQYLRQASIELSSTLKSAPFIVLVLIGVLNIVGNSLALNQMFDTSIWPVTSAMIQVISGSFFLYVFIILVFFGGELVWKERQLKLNEVFDALPVPNWVIWASKMTALAAALFSLQAVAMLTSIVFQLSKGYSNIEAPVYLSGLFFDAGIAFLLMAVLSFFFQVLGSNKYLGFLLMTIFFISLIALRRIGLEHVLYRYAQVPSNPWSDMNGYGHFMQGMIAGYAYWTAIAAILMVVVHLFWVRGTESALGVRATLARRRLTRGPVSVLVVAGAIAAALGGWIFYNTNVVNKYVTQNALEEGQAEFEKKYKQYEGLAQPRVVAVNADVDLFPAERDANVRGSYVMKNKTSAPIGELHLWLNPLVKGRTITVPDATVRMADRKNGYTIYRLGKPLQPGETMTVTFDLAIRNDGFTNNRGVTNFVENGTFFNNYEWFPYVGYQSGSELVDTNKRRKYGLQPIQRMPKLGDPKWLGTNYLGSQSDWLTFETTVSTSADQIAIAPGYLQREWTGNGRRYFHYKMDSPILGFWSYLSARYTVKRDRWNDVAIEVYYHEPHAFNVDRMIESVKKSLDYYTKNFGPYQHKQVRIIEFPGYERFAQSFPNTIPYSEAIGFVARIEKPEDIDYVFYVTAHEVAHQWWAHQVIGAQMQGATVLSETLSQYSALMVMEKEYGKETMKRFLKFELESYLRGRGSELVAEMPLELVENQGYIHYRKGSLVMYALRDYMGEEALNRALAKFVNDHKFAEPPYPTSRDLLEYIRAEASPELQPVITDLFEKITIYENKATSAKATKRADGKWVVTVEVEAGKYYATSGGKEEPVKIGDLVDIGVLGPDPKDKVHGAPILYLEKKRIDQPKMKFEAVVDSEPAKAGIDPLNKLIDRNPEDNLKAVEKK
ncbi:MAG: M1 family aminopeptidase [Thermoanaerobaculia bacterium]|jgi:ABC-type transport system involved in multi-copper enzyme maturation permease subunit